MRTAKTKRPSQRRAEPDLRLRFVLVMGRGGLAKTNASPERRCIGSGEVKSPELMIRFVLSPDSVVTPDIMGKLPGRGIWLSADAAALKSAIKKNAFARSAKTQAKLPENLAELVEAGLVNRLVELISLARKAGQAVAGFEKAKDWLEKDQAEVLIQSKDGSERGKSKLRPPRGSGKYIDCLSSKELGLAFGRENVIHGALKPGGLSRQIVVEARRLDGVRNGSRPAGRKKGKNNA